MFLAGVPIEIERFSNRRRESVFIDSVGLSLWGGQDLATHPLALQIGGNKLRLQILMVRYGVILIRSLSPSKELREPSTF